MSWVILVFAMSMFWSWNGKSRRRLSRQEEARIAALEADVAGRDDLILALETRVAELESRLDFAERLLASQSESRAVGQSVG